MPPRKDNKITVSAYLKALKAAQDAVLERALRTNIESTTPWELYSDLMMRGGLNRQIVDGHIRFALKEYRFSKDFDIRRAGTIMLACGFVLARLDEDGEWDCEDPEIIEKVRFKRGEPVSVEIEYEFEKETPDGRAEEWVHEAYYFYRPDSKEPVKRWREYKCGTPEDQRPLFTTDILDIFPYRGVEWVTRSSIYTGSTMDIIRHSELLGEVGDENRRKSRMALHYTGVSGFASTIEEQKEEGRVILGKDANAFYPDTNPSAMSPMFEEMERLESLIRDNTGYVKVMALHNASATSRQYEYWPLESQALSLRGRIKALVSALFGANDLWFPPLLPMTPQEIQVELLNIGQLKIDGAIDPAEVVERERDMMRLPRRGAAASEG